jgi:hypothetical protein
VPVQKVNPERNIPLYDSGGRAPHTKSPARRVTVTLDEKLIHDLEKWSEKFINPSTLKPYGISAIARECLLIGIETIDSVTEKDLLYYIEKPDKPKGKVGRRSIADKKCRTTFLVQIDVIKRINRHLKTLDSDIIATTTYIRYFLKKYISSLTVTNLYASISKKHKELMIERGFTPKNLAKIYKNR